MFIKSLKISKQNEIIRNLEFKKGLNLIVDNTSSDDLTKTGNNIGKTTVLKLISFCLAGDSKDIYKTNESKDINDPVKDFLVDNKVLITLELIENIDNPFSKKIVIQRNFLKQKEQIIRVNNKDLKNRKELTKELLNIIFPKHKSKKPSFRQIISHNLRYNDQSINNTLKTLPNAKDSQYEILNLFLFGFSFLKSEEVLNLQEQLKLEYDHLKKLLSNNLNKEILEQTLEIIKKEINELNKKKETLNINEDFKENLDSFNEIKHQISVVSSKIALLEIRKNTINEFVEKMNSNRNSVDLKQLELIFNQTNLFIPKLHKTFDQLVDFHNKMLDEKIAFANKELPDVIQKLVTFQNQLNDLLKVEKELSVKLSKDDTFKELDKIIGQLNEKHYQKGEFETKLNQINDSEKLILDLEQKIKTLTNELYSEEFEEQVKNRVKAFNTYFVKMSQLLYKEWYSISVNKKNEKNKPIYQFSLAVLNNSSGKKQGEIICYDLAYIQFADHFNIDCLHFLLNDKKELMSDNQLSLISDYLVNSNAQLIISMLKDKIPSDVFKNSHVVLELSQEDKLFKF
ncbi:DUF2326 domain-containing protein [Mycoplasma feriruminatoris]|uniref:DUF2326 domain-containing protein n=1 Tax=Mycoplasma feriruminatoris TaxID=1179777 RepID=A0A654I9N8_9MOLU|nr:DUF2326 domain-containing protein [Mycoplasma feriruminatoris]UKS53965.1 hypothetical protein D500_00309 [Mycoplasma feriruminatoris]UKS53986.1 hypothetical protein D500_00330 [Mycoplasma feriruminatoris]VZK65152.1 hypothetical protein MF5292_00317 [Mycoplasma feriruminatoris]VZR75298.1 hypothetical protein MF5294_00318 [Mycoplasma feriruminatoris]VZR97432.1 hypothetical protein MF5293_00317 [Mycoplasma feriruminatoris]